MFQKQYVCQIGVRKEFVFIFKSESQTLVSCLPSSNIFHYSDFFSSLCFIQCAQKTRPLMELLCHLNPQYPYSKVTNIINGVSQWKHCSSLMSYGTYLKVSTVNRNSHRHNLVKAWVIIGRRMLRLCFSSNFLQMMIYFPEFNLQSHQKRLGKSLRVSNLVIRR